MPRNRAEGKLQPNAKRMIRPLLPGLNSELCRKYPLDEKAVKQFTNDLLEGKSQNHLYEILLDSFKNLPKFAEWYTRDYENISQTNSWLRNVGGSTRSMLIQNRESIEKLYSMQADRGLSNKEIINISTKNLTTIFEQMPKTLIPNLAKKFGIVNIPQLELKELPHKAPSLFTGISVMGGITKKTLQPLNNERPPAISDIGDIIHTLYLPHVDIFRADRFTASVIKEIKLPFNTTVVNNLRQLPKAIEERINNK